MILWPGPLQRLRRGSLEAEFPCLLFPWVSFEVSRAAIWRVVLELKYRAQYSSKTLYAAWSHFEPGYQRDSKASESLEQAIVDGRPLWESFEAPKQIQSSCRIWFSRRCRHMCVESQTSNSMFDRHFIISLFESRRYQLLMLTDSYTSYGCLEVTRRCEDLAKRQRNGSRRHRQGWNWRGAELRRLAT